MTGVCRAQYSIQREINNIIRSEGFGWGKRIRDESYREELRSSLRSQDGLEWCDYRASQCSCDGNQGSLL